MGWNCGCITEGGPREGGNEKEAFLYDNDNTDDEEPIVVGTVLFGAGMKTGVIPKPLSL